MELSDLLSEFGIEAKERKEESEDIEIERYHIHVGEQYDARTVLQKLVEYFGEPKKQKSDVFVDQVGDGLIKGDLVFGELGLVQQKFGDPNAQSCGYSMLGRYNIVIMQDQLAFRKEMENDVHLAVYKPFEDTVEQFATVNIYEIHYCKNSLKK